MHSKLPFGWRSSREYRRRAARLSGRSGLSAPDNLHRAARATAGIALYAAVSAYFRFRPEPEGINGTPRSYQVPTEDISFCYDGTWYEDGRRQAVRQIADEVVRTIRRARRLVMMDVFLFNLHHAEQSTFVPTTRQIADAFADKQHPSWFITDPLNTTYGTAESEPLTWLAEQGVEVCMTDLEKLRDNNLLYAPIWHLLLRHFGRGRSGWLPNPLRRDGTTTFRAILAALTLRGNHRKVVIADEDDTWVTIITSSNFEDSSSYFCNTAVKIRSASVARHFLEAEKAVARMSGRAVPLSIPEAEPEIGAPSADVTPLMGSQIKRALLQDVATAGEGDELFVFVLFLSDRDVIEALIRASRRGVAVGLVLDENRVSFGSKKSGFPNQIVAAELARKADLTIRWANTEQEEFHSKLIILSRPDTCILHAGSANLTRRSLSGTNLEANVRIAAPSAAAVSRDTLHYARRMLREPHSRPFDGGAPSRLRYGWYRVQEAVGIATY